MPSYPKEYIDSAIDYLKSNNVDFSEAKILITGASGFVGSWLIELLREYSISQSQVMQVVGITRNSRATQEKIGHDNFRFVNWVEGGVEKIAEIQFEFTHALHCATPTTKETGSQDIENMKVSSIDGMKFLLNAAKLNCNKPRILHTSTGAVYGNVKLSSGRFPLTQNLESYAIDNSSRHFSYGKAKRQTEDMLLQANKDGYVSGVNARLFAFYGPGVPTKSHYAIGNLIDQAINSRVLTLNGTGMATRSYMPGNAMAASILFTLSSEIVGATHIGSGEGKTLQNWAQIISDVSGKQLEVLNKFDDSADKYVPTQDQRIPEIHFQKDAREIVDRWITYEKFNSR